MKNLKLLAASIVAGSLIASSSEARIEGTYIDLGLGTAAFPNMQINAKMLDATSVIAGVGYAYNYEGFIVSIDLNYQFLDLGVSGDSKKEDVEEIFYCLGAHQFLGRLNLGYELTDSFAVFANVGMTAQGSDKSKSLVEGKKLLSNIGFVWGFGVRYALSKNWSVRGDLGFNSVCMTKDLKDAKDRSGDKITNGVKSLNYKTTSFTVSYNF